MLQVYLVRHGETLWNAARRIQGQSDSPLTEIGIRQAHLVAQRVRNQVSRILLAVTLGVLSRRQNYRRCLRANNGDRPSTA